ncbi:MAG TPA: hypothetical protein VI306_16265 [Pyrinomonadaceae bacterium]
MAQITEPIEQLTTLFRQSAQAVLSAQRELDKKLGSVVVSSDLSFDPVTTYSIPQTKVEISFGLEVLNSKRVLIPFLSGTTASRELHGHTLTFALIATPEAPRPPNSNAQFEIQALQPSFMISPAEQDSLSRELAAALTAGNWDFAFPEHGDKPTQKKVNAEAKKIIQALTPDNPERGMVVFKLDTEPTTYLVIRVTDKSKKDGVFVLNKIPNTEVMVYSFDGDSVDNIRYAALHQFILTLRNWLAGGSQPVPVPKPLDQAADPSPLGLIALDDFAKYLYLGYVDGLQFLSAQTADATLLAALPSFYDLVDVEGRMTYSVYYDENAQRMRFSFGPRTSPDGATTSDDLSVVESKAFIRAFRRNDQPQVEVKLIAPEFAVTDEGRKELMSKLTGNEVANKIADSFGDTDREIYLDCIREPGFQAAVVILLSYKGKTPKPNFLAAWPGFFQNKQRDFVFSFELKNDEIKNIQPIMGLGQEIELETLGGTIGVEITQDQYEPFHNAFHAVRIWRSRVELS